MGHRGERGAQDRQGGKKNEKARRPYKRGRGKFGRISEKVQNEPDKQGAQGEPLTSRDETEMGLKKGLPKRRVLTQPYKGGPKDNHALAGGGRLRGQREGNPIK